MERKAYTAFGETGFGETGRHRLPTVPAVYYPSRIMRASCKFLPLSRPWDKHRQDFDDNLNQNPDMRLFVYA